jgi:hypothetical protein
MGVNTMTQQDEDKGKTTGNAPVQDEQSKTPEKGELRDEELEKTSGGLLHPGPYPLNPQPLPP